MQPETALKVIEKKLGRVRGQLDRHDTRHANLFLAYFSLKAKSDREDPG